MRPQAAGEHFPAAIGGLADNPMAMLRHGATNPGPTAPPVGVRLVEHPNSLPADAHEVVHQATGLLPIGGAQVEGEVAIGRLALGLSAGEGEEEVDVALLELLQHRQHPGHGRGADVAEQQEHVVL